MEAFFFLLFIGMIWGLITLFDKNNKNKDGIISSEIIIMTIPYFILGYKLSDLYWDNKISGLFVWFTIISFTSIVVYLFKSYNKKRFKKIDDENMRILSNQIEWNNRIQENRRIKKENYMTALRSGNKSTALQLGREYYSSLGLYDEQRIQNDLLCFLNIK